MSEWMEYALEDFTEINPRESLPKGSYAKKFPMDVLGEFRRNLNSFEYGEYSGGAKFRNRDTLIARITPCLQNGKTAFVDVLDDDDEIAYGSTEYIVFREKEGISHDLFLYYLSISPLFRQVAIKSMTGSSGRQRVQNDVLKSYTFNLPPLPEQKAIAHILGKLDDKIELNRQMNQTLEEMAQALFKSWFVDFDPVFDKALAAGNEIPEALKAKAERRKLVPDEKKLITKNPELAQLFPSQFTFNETLDKWIPEGWEMNKIENVGKIVTGKTPSSKNPEQFGDIYPFVTPTDFKNYFKIITSAERNLSQEGFNKNHNRILPKDSVIVTCIGSDMGKVAMNKVKCLTNQQINSVVSNNKFVSAEYLYHFFKWSYDLLRNLAFGGSTMPILNKTDFGNIDIIIPPLELINSANKSFKRFDDMILNNVKESDTLTQLRDTLLPQLISGKVRVPEAFVKQD